jgi:hypothetical protein
VLGEDRGASVSITRVTVPKLTLDAWWASVEGSVAASVAPIASDAGAPLGPMPCVPADTWDGGALDTISVDELYVRVIP